jgi:hypothetical protein
MSHIIQNFVQILEIKNRMNLSLDAIPFRLCDYLDDHKCILIVHYNEIIHGNNLKIIEIHDNEWQINR